MSLNWFREAAMFVLHVEIKPKPSSQAALEKTYLETFLPAISRREGFVSVNLLRPVQDGGGYRLSIAFDNMASQQQWVATDVHENVWPQMENQCAAYSVMYYNAVSWKYTKAIVNVRPHGVFRPALGEIGVSAAVIPNSRSREEEVECVSRRFCV
jgi:heme-degrading monooxygenase HmoA